MPPEKAASPPWFFLETPLSPPGLPYTVELSDPDLLRHIRQGMRLRVGEQIVLVDRETQIPYLAMLEVIESRRMAVTLLSALPCPESPPVYIIAAIALLKEQKWDLVLQKLTELGVSEIVPLITKHTVPRVNDPESKMQRWEGILKHATQQSEQVKIPKLNEPVALPFWLEKTGDMSCKLVATEREGMPLASALPEGKVDTRIVFAIGPEGGWSAEEIDLFTAAGFQSVSLGATILRAETAAIYLMSVLRHVCYTHPSPAC